MIPGLPNIENILYSIENLLLELGFLIFTTNLQFLMKQPPVNLIQEE